MLMVYIYAFGIAVVAIGVVVAFLAQRRFADAQLLLNQAKDKWNNVKRDIENEKKESFLRIKDELYKKRKEFETDLRREKLEDDRLREKLNQKFEALGKKEQRLDDIRLELQTKERELLKTNDSIRSTELKVKNLYEELIVRLERLSNMSKEEAKQALAQLLEDEVRHTSEKWIQKVEQDTKDKAKERVADIVVTAMQRYTSDYVPAATSAVVQLPSEDMKGRVIGKEGRNIKSLEMATGMEFVIGDTPEVITISGFNPIRREIARRSLEALVNDGRINPTRIEEMVAKYESEVDELIQEFGKNTILEFNLQGVHPEIVTLLGKLHFRTSFSQNVLQHSKEVAYSHV